MPIRFDVAARTALFIIYAWFGALKLFGASAASPMIDALGMGGAIVLIGAFEVILAALFLFPLYTKVMQALFIFHMAITTLPLIVLPALTWVDTFTPTMEGQYIVKNLALIALVVGLGQKKRKE